MNRRGFFRFLAAAIATPLAQKILPARVQANILDRINAETQKYISPLLFDDFFQQSPLMCRLNGGPMTPYDGGEDINDPLDAYWGEDDDEVKINAHKQVL